MSKPSKLDAPLPDQPTPKHTKLITCIDCGAKRWVKPQDAFQVKRCRSCQEQKRGGKSKARLVQLKAKTEERKEFKRIVAMVPRLFVLKYTWLTPQERAAIRRQKVKRIWP
ncbi:MAG: hypothetical protein WC822_02425 [Candidatus Paceibacterota bacterium]|jgi:hypothetical protein